MSFWRMQGPLFFITVIGAAIPLVSCGGDGNTQFPASGGAGGSDAGSGGAGLDSQGGAGGDGDGGGDVGGGGAGGGGYELGIASPLPDCTLPANAPPDMQCKALAVSCPNVDDTTVELLVRPPPAAIRPRGTVLLGSGGQGMGFYHPQTSNMIRQLGFTIVRRAWAQPWETGPGGMDAAACRYATLVTWLAEQDFADGPLCATGNSGGAAEISYALARYGRDEVIDFAVPSGGPPMTRLDLACLGGAGWSTECTESVPSNMCNGSTQVQCSYNDNQRDLIDLAYPDTPCNDMDAAMAATLQEDSILSPDAAVAYNTPLHFIFGLSDCTIALPLGLMFANAVTSTKQIEYVDAPHATFSTAAGRAAIVAAIDSGCVAAAR